MNFLKSIFLTRFFFVLFAAVVAMYCCSSMYAWMFFVSNVALLCLFGALLMSLFCARHFGRFHGGNTPEAQ